MSEKSIDEHARTLRVLAEMTAANSKNWDNYENICRDMIRAAHKAGRLSTLGERSANVPN